MLYFVLVISTFLLVVANLIVFRTREPVGKTASLCVAVAVGPFFVSCVLPMVAFQGLFLALAVIVWKNSGRDPSYFLRLSCVATFIAFVMAGWLVWKSESEAARLQSLYPYESMEERLPEPRRDPNQNPLTAATVSRLDRVEDEISRDRPLFRDMQLARLHDDAVRRFIDSAGFGFSRMPRGPNEWVLAAPLREKPTPLQPGPRVASTWSPGEHQGPPAGVEPFLRPLYEDSIRNFVFAAGFGYVKDRRHVAGFVPHRFLEVPSPTAQWEKPNKTSPSPGVPPTAERWKVRTLDLMGLLLHEAPVVYISDHLPRMAELRGAPTRPLDKFEALGLSVLRRGEDLFTSRDGKHLRMLGAVYSITQCVNCHGGERGDLLGAFSYTLQADDL
jgi:hypothetical protein